MKKIVNYWKKNVVETKKCIGKPTKNIFKDNLMGIIGIFFLVMVEEIVCNPENKMLKFFQIDNIEGKYFTIGLFMLAFIFSLFYWIVVQTELHKKSRARKVFFYLKYLALTLLSLFNIFKKCVDYVLNIKKQKNIAENFPIMFVGLIFSLYCNLIFLSVLKSLDAFLKNQYNIILNNELIAFILVFFSILCCFKMCKLFVIISIMCEVFAEQKSKLRKNKDEIEKKQLCAERKEIFEYKWEIIKEEVEYTKLYFYIFVTFVILCAPIGDDKDLKLFADTFLGITTLAALARETKK